MLRRMLLHGPDTVERFAEFSMSAVITELPASCPQLYQLVQQLGCTLRNARDGCLPDEELKGVMAVCIYSSERTVCKGEGTVVSDQSDAGRKGNRQTGTYIHVEYTHTCTQIILESICTHICTMSYTSRFRP